MKELEGKKHGATPLVPCLRRNDGYGPRLRGDDGQRKDKETAQISPRPSFLKRGNGIVSSPVK